MVKEIDVIDKGLLQLSRRLFDDNVDFYDYEFIEHSTIDGVIEIGASKVPFVMQSNPTITSVNHVFGILKEESHLLFIFDGASKKTIDYCLNQQINFIDSSGNAYLKLPNLKIWLNSDTNKVDSSPSISRAFQKSGLIILFELFNDPELLKLSYRELSKYCGISISSIAHVFDDLKGRGFLLENKFQERKLINCKQLILKWAYSYNENLRPGCHRGYFEFLDKSFFNSLLITDNDLGFKVSGAKGLSLLNKYINADQVILYSDLKLSRFARDYKILPASKFQDGTIEILEPFWNINKYGGSSDNNLVVDEILLFADLLNATDYRIIESAENLLNNEIRNRFIKNKFQW